MTTMVSAQAKGDQKASKTKPVTVKSNKAARNRKADTVQLSNRDIYEWSSGQKATPTGEQATSSNGSGYATLKKDTGRLVRKGKKKQ